MSGGSRVRTRFIRILLAITGLCCQFFGCANLSNFQTAEVLEISDIKSMSGITVVEIATDGDPEELIWDENYVVFEGGGRMGLSDRLDGGLRFALNSYTLGVAGDLKFQWIDSKFLDASIDAGLGINTVDEDLAVVEGGWIYDIFSSLLFTFNFSEAFKLTLVPRVKHRSITSTGEGEWETLTGGTLTLALGKDFVVLPEVGFMRAGGIEYVHYGIGFSFYKGDSLFGRKH